VSRCEIREGIGLCDECSLPKWPQLYLGYGIMVCLDCLLRGGEREAKTNDRMKELFQLIDELCRNSRTPIPICIAFGLDATYVSTGGYIVNIAGQYHELPDKSCLTWRRQWRSFLTDHANLLTILPYDD